MAAGEQAGRTGAGPASFEQDIRQRIRGKSPVEPVKLELESRFRFDCHPGVPCFNACCRNIDIQLTPYDIVRLKQRLQLSSSDFVARYTVPFEMDHHGLPGLKMLTKPGGDECVFLTGQGCSVYEDRPAACRYYALGNMAVRPKDRTQVEDVYFVVREPHCRGHEQPRTQSVGEYRRAQGVERYDDMNREWRDVILKKRSSGPTVGAPSARSMQLFDMCSYDIDSFRDFTRTPAFRDLFDLDAEDLRALDGEDEALLVFSMRFLKQALFGENTIRLREEARSRRLRKRSTVWAQRHQAEIARHRQETDQLRYQDAAQYRAAGTACDTDEGDPA